MRNDKIDFSDIFSEEFEREITEAYYNLLLTGRVSQFTIIDELKGKRKSIEVGEFDESDR